MIPCHNEPDLIGTLESLILCEPVGYKVEVIVVVNDAEGTRSDVRFTNERTIESFENWIQKNQHNQFSFHLIEALGLPKKHAGVGLARKIGMDEALRRFISIGKDGTIVCLDADCTVSKNYLLAIDKHFVKSAAGLGEVYFEHVYEKESNEDLKQGIINYELFLRYYVKGLQQAGFPYAIQTIGSCMLVKASVYAKHGGMNKKKAGEDFYFLHKIIPHEAFTLVNQATVYPSCRVSDRVPFGTGKAQNDWLNQKEKTYFTYAPKVFDDLKALLGNVEAFYINKSSEVVVKLPEAPRTFIKCFQLLEKIEAIKANCPDVHQFQKQFFIWFDGFMCMKFVHFVRDHFHDNVSIQLALKAFDFSKDKRVPHLILALEELET